MLAWLSANLINIALIALIGLIVALLIRGMVRDRKAGKRSCSGNCASCGACGGCSACGKCGGMNPAVMGPEERKKET
ncbi:MAG: FeoB-associated Cys-rich membrane protein [Oscillospiraceae bacterium]|nr:FeoB-associated Cys-rich membrane protein [Oscillospiraceae bacterium]